MRHLAWLTAIAVMCMAGCQSLSAQDETLINGFESDAELNQWTLTDGGHRLVREGATEGGSALEMTFDPNGQWFAAHMQWARPVRDWSPYDALVVDVLNANDSPVRGNLLVADQAWQDGGASYWNRHNSDVTFAPGAGRWVIPVQGLYRGEAGSRNNDIKRDIDPDQIVRLDLGFGGKGLTGRIIVDNIRFAKVDRPGSVWAFDFGPPSQPVMLGWTAASHATGYDADAGFGWFPANNSPWDGADRDTTFGTMLTQDFCEAGGYSFRVDVPAGDYECLLIYENCGYWGGEQSRCAERQVYANGDLAWSEQRPDGRSTALLRFEDVEPVGVDIWDTYMASEVTKPVRLRATAMNEGITFRFEADEVWGSKLSALALHEAGDDQAADWLSAQIDAVADEFRAKAVCLDPEPEAFDVPEEWREKGLVAWPVSIEDEVTPNSVPQEAPAPDELRLACDVVRGEHEPLCLAVRPTRDLGACSVTIAADRDWPETALQVVRYNTSRGFGSIAYNVRPHTLRYVDPVDLPANVTREFIFTLNIYEDYPARSHEATAIVRDAEGNAILRVPLEVTIHDIALARDTGYLMGFFGLMPPESLLPDDELDRDTQIWLQRTLGLLQTHGVNAVSGGPSFRLTGWQMGVPQVDFGRCDEFFALLKEHGFDKAINGYGGLRFVGLHDRYQKGATGEKVEQDSGLDYETAVMRAWEVVDEHARANGWPLIYYAMCDETRVRAQAEGELEFMKLMAKVSARFPETVRPSGSYSVDFTSRPTDEDDLLLWHQRFFGALDVSSLNGHNDSVMAEADKLGKEIHIYNQGRTRYSFGLYQWSEYRKGVAARWQWHLNVLHGYQFFDLDGREPDTAMICYGRKGIYPTIHFERCREGAEDFYLLQTLANLIEANKQADRKPTETQAAEKWLTELTDSVALNERNAPRGYDADAMKLEAVRLIEGMK